MKEKGTVRTVPISREKLLIFTEETGTLPAAARAVIKRHKGASFPLLGTSCAFVFKKV